MIQIEVSDNASSQMLEANQLSENWNTYPAPDILRKIGNAWLLSKSSLLLYVPSVIDPLAQNVLINPLHSEINLLKIAVVKPFTFDNRLIKAV